MRVRPQPVVLALFAALIALGYGIYRTDQRAAPIPTRASRRSPSDRSIVVDQTSLNTAEQLVRMPTTPDERPYAEDALRLADQELDLAFAQAVRQTASQTRPLSPEAKALDAQLQQALRTLAADQAQVAELTAAVSKATPATMQ